MNGGIFIKVGQHIGTLDYLLPEEYVKTMKVLHTDAPQSSFESVVAVVEEECGAKFDEMFTSFSEKPVGSASLAQVCNHSTLLLFGNLIKNRAHRLVPLKLQNSSFNGCYYYTNIMVKDAFIIGIGQCNEEHALR